jgi:hypothetical protein
MSRVEGNCGAAVRARLPGCQRRTAGKLAHLAAELAWTVNDNGRLMSQSVAVNDVDRALHDKPRSRMAFSDIENDLSGAENVIRSAREAAGGLDLDSVQGREYLVVSGIEQGRHCLSLQHLVYAASRSGL